MGITCKCMLKDSIIGLQNNGQEIKWNHLWSLYHRNRSPTGLAILPYLNSFSKDACRPRCSSKHSACACMLSNWDLCAFKCRFSVALYQKA